MEVDSGSVVADEEVSLLVEGPGFGAGAAEAFFGVEDFAGEGFFRVS